MDESLRRERIIVRALRNFVYQANRNGLSGYPDVAEAEAMLAEASAQRADFGVRHPFDSTCVTVEPLMCDLSEPDACRQLGISRSTFGRRARRLGLEPVCRERGRANRWSAADVVAIGSA